MKPFKTLSALLIAILILSSCQKEYSLSPGSTTVKDSTSALVKTYTEDITLATEGHIVNTFNLTYDANDRITSLASDSTGDKFVYKYNSDNTYTLDIYNSNRLSIHELFWINSYGLVDSTIQYNDGRDTMTEKYLYNSSKQLVKLKEFDYSTANGSVLDDITSYEYDNNGNVSKETNQYSESLYEYYPDLLNNVTLGQLYFFRNKNLPKVATYNDGVSTITLNHTYTFDSKNRLSTERAEASNGTVAIKTYTY